MNDRLQPVYASQAGSGALTGERNRVRRNTYLLLALSMVPTVLGAWIGVTTGVMARMGMGLSTVLFLGGAFGMMFSIEKLVALCTRICTLSSVVRREPLLPSMRKLLSDTPSPRRIRRLNWPRCLAAVWRLVASDTA